MPTCFVLGPNRTIEARLRAFVERRGGPGQRAATDQARIAVTDDEMSLEMPAGPVLEVVSLDVIPGREAAFEAAFARAGRLIASMPG